jgi:hypothetical protein
MRQSDRGDLADLARDLAAAGDRARRHPALSAAGATAGRERYSSLCYFTPTAQPPQCGTLRHIPGGAMPAPDADLSCSRCCSLGCALSDREAEAEARGYERGYRQAVKEQYWIIQNQQRSARALNPPRHETFIPFSCSRPLRAMDRQRPGQHGGQLRRAGRSGRQPHRNPPAVGRAVGAAQPPAPGTRAQLAVQQRFAM